ncbi:MAG: hypothetical protein K6T27_06935 [Thermoleophilum sp.]|nr:hypothetical protein [Thermoleophilum sp.]
MSKTVVTLVLALLLAVAGATSASAQSSGEVGYGSVGGVVEQTNNTPPTQAVVNSGGSNQPSESSRPTSASLPFTGAEVGLMVLVATGLIATGLVARRVATRASAA